MDSMRVMLAVLIILLFAAMPANCEEPPARLDVVAEAAAASAPPTP
jgi:hypothetical protein